VSHALTIEAELVAPILAVKGPELMLLVDDDLALPLSSDVGRGLRLGAEPLALRRQDLELDCIDLVGEILKFIDKAAIAATREIARLIDREASSDLDIRKDAHPDARVLEFVGHILEPVALLIERANVCDVREHRAIGERAAHDRFDVLGKLCAASANVLEELVGVRILPTRIRAEGFGPGPESWTWKVDHP